MATKKPGVSETELNRRSNRYDNAGDNDPGHRYVEVDNLNANRYASGLITLLEQINADLWLIPESGAPGLNAVTGEEDFILTGSVTYDTGDGAQEVIQMAGGDRLDATAGFGAGTYLRELHNEMQFWFFVYWNPQGDTDTFQDSFITTNTTSAGYRLRLHGDGSGGQLSIHDGTAQVAFTPPISEYAEFDGSAGNAWLVQVNMIDEWIEVWCNNKTTRTETQHRRSMSGLSFPSPDSPRANTIAPQCSLNGVTMFGSGRGILTETQIEQLMQYGRGLSWSALNAEVPVHQNSCRFIPRNDEIQVVGNFDKDVTFQLYADVSRTERGASLQSSGVLTRDGQGWASHTFTGLTADTRYQIFFEYEGSLQDRRRGRIKTLPSARDGLLIGLASCNRFEPALPFTDATGLENQTRGVLQPIFDQNFDVLVLNGDDGYMDTEWREVFGLPGEVPMTADEFQQVNDYIFDRVHMDGLFSRLPYFPGAFSDHDAYGGDTDGASAINVTAAQTHLAQRHGITYPNAPTNLYNSWQTTGITWIVLDTRTEMEAGVQQTSAAQRQDMEDDMTAAVGRDDLIILLTEKPFSQQYIPVTTEHWDHSSYATELTDLFDRMVTAGATDRIIMVFGDVHAGGVDTLGAQQGGHDTGGIVAPLSILASRLNHELAGSNDGSTGWPNYWDTGLGHFMELLLEDSTTQFSFSYDNELTGPFTETETLTFGSGATATLDTLRDDGVTGRMQCTLVTGSKPSDPDTIAGATATADIDGTTPWMVDLTVTPHELGTPKTPITRTIG